MKNLPWGNVSYLKNEEFYNRIDELNLLKSLLSTTNQGTPPAIMIPGIRGVGKTALLKKIKEELSEEYLVNYIDLTQTYSYQLEQYDEINLMQVFYKSWLDACKEKGLNVLTERIKKIFKTNKIKLGKIVNFGGYFVPIPETEIDKAEIMNLVLELPQTLYNSHQKDLKGFIMIIDEFQAFNDLGTKLDNFLWLFRSFIQNQKNVAYIFSGSLNSNDEIVDKLAGSKGAFGGRMLTLELNPFSKETVKKYLNERVPSLFFADDGFDRFYECTKGIPYYVNTFANMLPKDIKLDNEKVKNEFLVVLPLLADHLKLQWGGLNSTQQRILTTLINQPIKRVAIAEKLGRSSNSLSIPLNQLVQMRLIENNNGVYKIAEPILKAWLKRKYQIKGVFPFRV
ncbi:MAG: AAA family ATPase [Methanobrevibacter sp.]|jgi:AAA+ ATPase superfamily predicted ATPase|nr:AAA family ATPase [Candidatus Methanoflexus mossambicus]